MRTAIFIGLLLIADAIKTINAKGSALDFLGWLLVSVIVMDVIEFMDNLIKKRS